MGATLAEMFDAEPTTEVDNYQLLYFKVGVSGSITPPNSLQVSTTGDVSAGLTAAQYGTGNLQLSNHQLIKNGELQGTTDYGVIPYSFIKRVTDTKCQWQIVLDEQTANIADEDPVGPGGQTALNEIGLFSKNPYLYSTDASMLCAYRYFKPVYKNDSFILVFRWTIEF